MQEKELIQNPNQRGDSVHSSLVMERERIIIGQRFDPAGEWGYPGFLEDLICIHLGQTVLIEQILAGCPRKDIKPINLKEIDMSSIEVNRKAMNLKFWYCPSSM